MVQRVHNLMKRNLVVQSGYATPGSRCSVVVAISPTPVVRAQLVAMLACRACRACRACYSYVQTENMLPKDHRHAFILV